MPLNLKSVAIALVNHVAVAQNIAYETIDQVSPQGTLASNGSTIARLSGIFSAKLRKLRARHVI
jgi:ribosomal protein L11 methylase PrmA